MKNNLSIDIDTERENSIHIYKSKKFKIPQTRLEKEKSVLDDIDTVCLALVHLIDISHQHQIKDKSELVKECIKKLCQHQ